MPESEQRNTTPIPTLGTTQAWRRWASLGLAALLVVLTPLAIGGIWTRGVLFDTDRYVETVAPLIEDPAIQQEVSDQITEQVVDALDPPLLPLDTLLEPLVRPIVERFVGSSAFASIWEDANRIAHQQVIAALSGESELIKISDTELALEISAITDEIAESLTESGFETIAQLVPNIDVTIVLFRSDDLPLIRSILNLLDAVGGWIWIVAVAVAVGAVVAARRRQDALVLVAGAVALGSTFVPFALGIARNLVLSSSGAGLSDDALAAVFDQLTSPLRTWSAIVLWLAVVVGTIAWVTGGLLRWLQAGAVALGALALTLLDHPSAWVVVAVVGLAAVAVTGLEIGGPRLLERADTTFPPEDRTTPRGFDELP